MVAAAEDDDAAAAEDDYADYTWYMATSPAAQLLKMVMLLLFVVLLLLLLHSILAAASGNIAAVHAIASVAQRCNLKSTDEKFAPQKLAFNLLSFECCVCESVVSKCRCMVCDERGKSAHIYSLLE